MRPGNVTARCQPHNSDTEYIAMASEVRRHPVTLSVERHGNEVRLLEKVGDVTRTTLRMTPLQADEIGNAMKTAAKKAGR